MKHTLSTSILILLILLSSISINSTLIYSNPERSDDNQNHAQEHYIRDWTVQIINQNNENIKPDQFFTTEKPIENTGIGQPKDVISTTDDHAWPTLSHDIQHTGRTPYSTENNSGAEIWRVKGDWAGVVWSSAVIDTNNTVYFGTLGEQLFALYPNGTRKWSYRSDGLIWCTPAIAEDGTLYFTTWGGYGYVHAVYPNGTRRWLYHDGYDSSSLSSPTIGNDGTIYFGSEEYKIYAVNPDGTEKWRYLTGYIIMSSPVVGNDGTIYIGSGDYYLYALYPNGTLRWRFHTGGEIKGSASIAPDGTIYVPSFDGYLYALYPNGTMKWRVPTGGSIAAAGVALAEDGTIYVGTEQLRAFHPNGSLKWTANVQGSIYGTVPAISSDGTIYVSAGGSLVAVNPDGSEKWRKQLTIAQIHSSPCIGPDDRVYVGSEDYGPMAYGYLHAFGLGPLRAEAYGPYTGAATEPLQFTGEAFGGTPPYTSYYWNFGDGNTSDEPKPTHIYPHRGNYTATFTVTDIQGNQSQDTAQVTIGYPLPKISLVKPQNAVYIFNIKILPWPYPLVVGRIMFQVEASQIEIGIDHVEFYYDGNLMHIDETSPYQWLYTGHAPPLHQTILIRVYDTKGNSNSITKTINKWF